jgi:hypothetical protein
MLTKDEARRIAANVADAPRNSPELILPASEAS